MKNIDENRLESDLEYRFNYLCDFIGFGPADRDAMGAAVMELGPLIPQMVEATYARLLAFDATARHFIPRQHGYDGPLPAALEALAASPQIGFRKEHLSRYFMQIFGRSFDAKLAPYLDMVGKIHTSQAGNEHIHVPLVQMNTLMGLLADLLFEAIGQTSLDQAARSAAMRAFSKVLWIQNDFISRHYKKASEPTDPFRSVGREGSATAE